MNEGPETHAAPPGGEGVTPCCGRTPQELPRTDFITGDPAKVDCSYRKEQERHEDWKRVTLSKWQHYLENVLPSGNPIAVAHHESGLLKCIPYLLGRPDLALTIERQDAAYITAAENRRVREAANTKQELAYGASRPCSGGAECGDPEHRAAIASERRAAEQAFRQEYLGEWKSDDPHRREDQARLYPAHGLDFGPSVIYPEENLGEQDCG